MVTYNPSKVVPGVRFPFYAISNDVVVTYNPSKVVIGFPDSEGGRKSEILMRDASVSHQNPGVRFPFYAIK